MTVRLRKNRHGASWMMDFTVMDPRGTRLTRVRRALPRCKSRAEAETLERRARQEVERALTRAEGDASGSTVTFEAFAARWTAARAADWSPNTQRVYDQVLRIHLLPAFGHRALASIGPEAIQLYKVSRLKGGPDRKALRPKTVVNHLAVLSAMFEDAVEWEVLSRNPVRKVRMPRPEVQEARTQAWSVEEARSFLVVVEADAPEWLPLFAFALRTGLRLGELAGLTWGDIDLDRCLVHVRRSLSNGHTTVPKGRRSREEPLPAELVPLMQAHRARVQGKRVFISADGRELTPDRVKSVFRRCTRRAGVPVIRFHDLRHTYGTHLAMHSGAPQRVVQELMGHADIRTTERYTHVDNSAKRTAVQNLPTILPPCVIAPGEAA